MCKHILLVEDDPIQGQLFTAALQGRGAVVHLTNTIEGAVQVYQKFSGLFSAILLDGCIGSETPNTQSLLQFFKENGFANPIIAISSQKEFSLVLCNAGATHMREKAPALVNFVLELIR